MMSRRDFVRLIVTLPFSGALLTACSRNASMRVAIHDWIGYESLYLAESQNKLPERVSLIKLKNNSEKMYYAEQGLVDAGAFTLDEVLLLRNKGVPLTIVTVLDISAGADVVLVRTDDNQKRIPIQANQRIAYEATQIGELMLNLLLDRLKLTPEQMRLIPLPIGEDQINAWQKDAADVIISYEPYASQLKRLGAKVAYSSRDFAQCIFDVFAVRTDKLTQMETTLRALLQTHFAIVANIKINRDEALYSIAARENISYDEANTALKGIILPSVAHNRALFEPGSGFYNATNQLNQLMLNHKQIDKADNLMQLFSSAYLPETEFDDTISLS